MKKRFFPLLAAALLLALSGCSPEQKQVAPAEAFTPLFRVSIADGNGDETKLISLPKSDGYFYLHAGENASFSGGFVSPKRSVSSEGIFKATDPLSFVALRETESDRATLLTPNGVTFALLKENGAQTTALPEDVNFQNALFFDDLTLLAEKEELLVLCPVDFKETYVLASKDRLPFFGEPLAVTHEKRRIWYTTKDESGAHNGIAFFEYGKNLPLGSETFPFDSFQRIGKSAVLFTRLLDDGGALYLYRDLETDSVASLTVEKPFAGVTCDPQGKVLCAAGAGEEENTVFVYDFQKDRLRTRYETSGTVCPSLSVRQAADELLFAVTIGSEQVFGTLDLTKIP